jgi:flagellar hook-length control protein FliK
MKTSTLPPSVVTPASALAAPRSALSAQPVVAAPPNVVAPVKSQAGTPSFAALMNKLHTNLPTPQTNTAAQNDERRQLEKAQARQDATRTAQNNAQNSQNNESSRAQKHAAGKSAGTHRSATTADKVASGAEENGCTEKTNGIDTDGTTDDKQNQKATGDDRAALWAGLLNTPTAGLPGDGAPAHGDVAKSSDAQSLAGVAHKAVNDPSNPGAAKDGPAAAREMDLAASVKAQEWQASLLAAGRSTAEVADTPAQPASVQATLRAGDTTGSKEAIYATTGDSTTSGKLSDEANPNADSGNAMGTQDFAQALSSAANTAPGAAPAAGEPVTGQLRAHPASADFASQLGAQLSTFVRDGVHHAQLELNPTDMGPLILQIELKGDIAQVNLSAENATTRFALEQAMPVLASSLREAGVTLAGGGVFEQVPQSAQSGDTSGGPRGDSSRQNHDTNAAAIDGTHEAHNKRDALNRMPALPAVAARRRGVVDLLA